MKFLTWLLLSGLSFFIALAAASEDWPAWRGAQRDNIVRSATIPESLPAAPRVVWRIPHGDGLASPVVAKGIVYHLAMKEGKETLFALDATGKEKWNVPLGDPVQDGFGTGPRTAATVDTETGLVYGLTCMGELKCLQAADGKAVWSKSYAKDFGAVFKGSKAPSLGASRYGNSACPLVDGEHLIVCPGGPGASVACLNKKTGDVIWKCADDIAGYAPPIVATLAGVRQVVAFTAIALIGVDRESGKLLWRVPIKTGAGRHVTTPITLDDMVFVSSHQAGLMGVKIEKSGAELKATEAWKSKEAAVNFASPLLWQGYLYGCGPAMKAICVEAKSGTIAWAEQGLIPSSMDKAYATFMGFGKHLLLLNDTGELMLLEHNTKAPTVKQRIKVCGNNWCSPAYADGKLYIRDFTELLCIELIK